MSREGLPTLFGLAVFGISMAWVGFRYHSVSLILLSVLAMLLLLFSIYFFRDPKRLPPQQANIVLSPADGKIIEVDTVSETEFMEGKVKRVAIFLSLFNVHVNYVPFKGTVDFIRFHRGSYLRANLPAAATKNVNILTGLQTTHGKIAFKQSTGMVARRIVNRLRLGDVVETGQKFGIIKFGSRMEVYLPLDAEIKVKTGDRVRAGETIIAEFYE